MRVLPYFQNVPLKRPANMQKPVERPADLPGREPAPALEVPEQKADVFIPSSLVTGVVYSIRPNPVAGAVEQTVVKSGNYSFYRLDGMVENKKAIGLGDRLDTKG
ncbi:MAG: hypothetical protein V1794_03100 [Candidatus Glassbacteria bacterium]